MRRIIKLSRHCKLILIIVFLCGSNHSFSQNCDAIFKFRDYELFNDYNRAFNTYSTNELSKIYVADVKEKILNASWWYTSDASVSYAVILDFMKVTCTFVGNIMKFIPAVGIVSDAVDVSVISAQNILDKINSVQNIVSVANGTSEKLAYQMMLSKAGPVGKAVKTLWDLSADIQKFAQHDKDRANLKIEVKNVIEKVESEISRYENAMAVSSQRINQYMEIKNAVDKYIAEKCR